MKLTLGELLNGKPALEKLVNLEISIKAAYKLSRIIRKLNEELQNFEEQRQKLVNQYGEPQENGNVIVTQENMEAFAKELNDLASLEIELDFEPVSLEELGDVKMKAAELMLIEKFVTE